MGDEITSESFSRKDRTGYRERLQENLEAFDRYLQEAEFAGEGTIGLEMEINLADRAFPHAPALRNIALLEELGEEFQAEIGAYNIELNHPVLHVTGRGLEELEQGLTRRLHAARDTARGQGIELVTAGILPTLEAGFFSHPEWMSPARRYEALNSSVLEARGEDVRIRIQGEESVDFYAESVAPESACTSVQLHLQVAPGDFASTWNAAQALAGPQLALAANSPLFAGRRLWHETRIPVFTQAIDTRPPELVHQGVRPRVWFGERWITSVFDLFEENVRYFPALLPESKEDAGADERAESGAPTIHELLLHNGTIWRWNRPIYVPGEDRPHLRVENRLLPAGPTVVDTAANAAFYYGLVRYLASEARPLWSRMSFSTARENFFECAKHGLDAQVFWPRAGTVPVSELLVKVLIPQAAEGLAAIGVDADLIDRYIGIVRERALTGMNGSRWLLDSLDRLDGGLRLDRAAGGAEPGDDPVPVPESRREALATITGTYLERQWGNEPVHTWPLA